VDLAVTRKKVDIPARCPYDLTSLQQIDCKLTNMTGTRIPAREDTEKGNIPQR
jgi:hypothetical protein